MKLCFGTYAKVLTLFLKNGRSNKDLLYTIFHSVDPACKLSDNAVSLLLACKQNLPNSRANGLGKVIDNAKIADAETVASYFSTNLPEMLVPIDRQLIILAILDLIFQDDSMRSQ